MSDLSHPPSRRPHARGTAAEPQPRSSTRAPSAVLAVDLGGSKCHGVLADAAGTVLTESLHPTVASDAAGTLVATLDDLQRAAAGAGLPVGVAVVGIPALIAPSSGLAVAGSNVSWHGFDLHGLLRERLDHPFFIDNDVNLAAHGEMWLGHGRDVSSLVTLSIGTGVGAAIVMNGRVWRGFHHAAGEVANMPIPVGPGANLLARLEDRVSGRGIAARATALQTSGRAAPWQDAGEVFAAAAQSDPEAEALLGAVLRDIAVAIVSITTVVDPEIVVLDGGVGRALAPWLDALRRQAASMSPFTPRLEVSHLQPNATVVGAIGHGLQFLNFDGHQEGDHIVIDA